MAHPEAKQRTGRRPLTAAAALPPPERDRVAAVLQRARETGLIASKRGRIAGRVSPELVERAKARTGIRTDTELLEFALASVAVEDNFAEIFCRLKGSVDPGLDLEF